MLFSPPIEHKTNCSYFTHLDKGPDCMARLRRRHLHSRHSSGLHAEASGPSRFACAGYRPPRRWQSRRPSSTRSTSRQLLRFIEQYQNGLIRDSWNGDLKTGKNIPLFRFSWSFLIIIHTTTLSKHQTKKTWSDVLLGKYLGRRTEPELRLVAEKCIRSPCCLRIINRVARIFMLFHKMQLSKK